MARRAAGQPGVHDLSIGKLFLLGLQPDGRLSVFERTFNRCLGLWGDGQTLWMTSLYQLWRFENALEPGQVANYFDRVYVPQVGYVTGDLDIHVTSLSSSQLHSLKKQDPAKRTKNLNDNKYRSSGTVLSAGTA
jgi:uncharacterized protein (TIGR03032 family)